MNMKILIASGAGGGTAKGRIGKHIHLKDFGEALVRKGVEYKLVYENDYVSGFPSKNIKRPIIRIGFLPKRSER